METRYYLVYNMRTAEGWEPFGKFFIGDDRQAATDLFTNLLGTTELDNRYPLNIDFMETVNGLPVNVKIKYCDLAQLGENSKNITKELFKHHLLTGNTFTDRRR